MRRLKWIPLFLTLILLLSASVFPVAGLEVFYDGEYHEYEGNIFRLKVNGVFLSPPVPPLVFSDYSVVPARSVFQDGLGAKVSWNGKTRVVTVSLDDTELLLTIDDTTAMVNGKRVEMPIPAKIINDTTMIPVRFVGEQLGMDVDFDSEKDIILIDYVPKADTVSVSNVSYSETSSQQGVLTITTDTDKPEYNSFILKEPTRLVVDVVDGVYKKIPTAISVANGNLSQIRFGQQADSARVVIDLSENLGYSVKRRANKILVTINIDPTMEPDEDSDIKPGVEPDDEPEITNVFDLITYGYEGGRDFIRFDEPITLGKPVKKGSVITVPIEAEFPEDMEEAEDQTVTGFFGKKLSFVQNTTGGTLTITLKTSEAEMYVQGNEIRLKSVHKPLARSVTIDAGHGGQDGGAVSYNEDGTIKAKEKDFNLDIALRAQKLLEAEGVEVHMIRDEDVYVDFLRVGSIANDAGTSLFVSVHTNSALTDTAHGIETYGFLDAGSVSNGMTSERLSEILLEELVDKTGAHKRGVKDGKSLAVINSTQMPATLIEIGFISNEEECEKMMTAAYRQKLAQAICDGVLRAFEEMDI
ncbi:MAG: N-acetylmuramoyl-L-alanine amidase [Clostridia bacterium]|nr:N-acetylmuramoyl-L-alanine amidase [Clostridia bacterium]